MSAGGHISQMIATLKSNARRKRDSFFTPEHSVFEKQAHPLPQQKASRELIHQIKKDLTHYRKKQRIKRWILIGIAGVILVWFIWQLPQWQIPSFLKEFWF